jgi:hypothetical protein
MSVPDPDLYLRIGSGFNWVSGPTRKTGPPKKRKELRNFIFEKPESLNVLCRVV